MKKIAIIVGTRPEVIKLAPVYLILKKSKKLKPILINTGQHKEMTSDLFKFFGMQEDFNLNLMTKNQKLPSLTARVIEATSKVFRKVKPNLVVVEGDTLTVMAASLAAFYLKIPVAHVEAGLRTDDMYNPFPEEMARRIVSHIASIHFAPTEAALRNLQKEGIKQGVYLTGNTVIDTLVYILKNINALTYILKKRNLELKARSLGFEKVDFKKYKVLLVTLHRRENFGTPHRNIARTLIKILDTFSDTAVLLPMHMNPNLRKVIKPILRNHKRVFLIEPSNYASFVYAMKNCFLILTDSGGIQEEAPTLGKPVLVLRTKTERPEGIKAGNAKLVGTDPKKIFKETAKLLTDKKAYKKMAKVKNPYGDGKAARSIVRILERVF